MPRQTLADKLAAEVIMHGGIPMTRLDVYTMTLEDTGSKQCADHFAWRWDAFVIDAKPAPIHRVREIHAGAPMNAEEMAAYLKYVEKITCP